MLIRKYPETVCTTTNNMGNCWVCDKRTSPTKTPTTITTKQHCWSSWEYVYQAKSSKKSLSALANFRILKILNLIWVSPKHVSICPDSQFRPLICCNTKTWFLHFEFHCHHSSNTFLYHVHLKYCKHTMICHGSFNQAMTMEKTLENVEKEN